MNDIETKLAAPIDKHDVKRRKSGGGEVDYITARTVMNRLDSVVGPSGWYDAYRPIEGGVECTLFIRFGDEWVGKTDVGTVSRVEPVKGMYSDALKRAACKWGIARELYQEGTALDDDEPITPQKSQPETSRRLVNDEAPARTQRGADTEPDSKPKGGEYDPALDISELRSSSWEKLALWMRNNMPQFKGEMAHVSNAFKVALSEAGLISGKDASWPEIYNAGLKVCTAYQAVVDHYAVKQETA